MHAHLAAEHVRAALHTVMTASCSRKQAGLAAAAAAVLTAAGSVPMVMVLHGGQGMRMMRKAGST